MSGDEMEHVMADVDGVDAGRCPLCGELNRCPRVEDSRCESCWCQAVTIPVALLERIPGNARMRACVCQCCVDDYRVHNGLSFSE